jgi:hypothetical protein
VKQATKEETSAEISEVAPLAEMSQPKCDIMANVPKDPKGRGRKCKWDDKECVNVNWKHPLVFSLIMEAQKEIKLHSARWSPQEIVSQCTVKSWLIFRHLLPQTLGCWID